MLMDCFVAALLAMTYRQVNMIINKSKLYHPQDAVKLAFQAAFGAEHLLLDKTKAKAYFDEEYAKDLKPAPLIEKIASDAVRVSLAAWKDAKLPKDWLFDMFLFSSEEKNMNSNKLFEGYLYEIGQLAEKDGLPFSLTDWNMYISDYNAHDKPKPVRHSDEYRKKEQPAYRIVSGFFVRLIPILYALRGKERAVIGIDGRAASGKSTMADGLAKIFKGVPISMDDFFLPGELRTAQRLDEPGGNVHYERFAEEVISNLRSQNAIRYRPFNCRTMDYDTPKIIPPSSFMVIEGAYCHHPYFGDYLDARVFSDVSANEQMRRLIKRNGEQIYEVFKNKWIPMEEQYFEAHKIAENACLTV